MAFNILVSGRDLKAREGVFEFSAMRLDFFWLARSGCLVCFSPIGFIVQLHLLYISSMTVRCTHTLVLDSTTVQHTTYFHLFYLQKYYLQ